MNREKKKCPYCQRKIGYGTKLIEHGKGEHKCSHCQKISKINQSFEIWLLLVFCLIAAAFIMVFYFLSAENIENTFREEGTGKILMTLFFGEAKEIKWILWEMVPFVVFYFLAPLFIEFAPLKRYMEQTSSIDLSVPTRTPISRGPKPSSKTRVIPKAQETQFSGAYEDISSSSGVESTRAFSISSDVEETEDSQEYTEITSTPTSKSQSYSSDVPLKRVTRDIPPTVTFDDVKEYVPKKEKTEDKTPSADGKKTPNGNYSGNRKF